jgi:archaellum component FlaG (FlaF/FlaG flagellin family)
MKKLFFFGLVVCATLFLSSFKNSDDVQVNLVNADGNPLPDLSVVNAQIKCASQRWLVFFVKNNGSVKNIATNVRIRPNEGHIPTAKCISQAVRNVPGIAPGKTFKVRVPLTSAGTGCDCTGELDFEIFVDHINAVAESDESNNVLIVTQ